MVALEICPGHCVLLRSGLEGDVRPAVRLQVGVEHRHVHAVEQIAHEKDWDSGLAEVLGESPVSPDAFWNIVGRAIEGPRSGTVQMPVFHTTAFWFAWAALYPDAELWHNDRATPLLDRSGRPRSPPQWLVRSLPLATIRNPATPACTSSPVGYTTKARCCSSPSRARYMHGSRT